MKYLITILTIAIQLQLVCFAQNNDAIKITEARIALEKYKDCKNALAALQEVSSNGQNNPLFHLYAGKTYDCLNNFDKAIFYYEQYLKTYPNASDILQRVAEMRYEKRKKENKYNLAGTWYIDGEPDKIRKINQYGKNITIYDPSDNTHFRIKFQGTLQSTGVFVGGRTWYFTKISTPDEDNRLIANLTCKKCVFVKMEYYDSDAEFSEQTNDDVVTLSEDGNSITIREKRPKIILMERRVEYEGVEKDICACELEWEYDDFVYQRVLD